MTRFCLFAAVAMLCGCRDHHRPFVDPIASLPAPLDAFPKSRNIEKNAPSPQVIRPPEPGSAVISKPHVDVSLLIGELNGRMQDVFFLLDSSEIGPDAIAVIQGNADLLKAAFARISGLVVTIEGHCDERGSAEYNLALGDRRARRVGGVLHEFASQLPAPLILSYGKEAPQCTEAAESCWQRNRRAHFVVKVTGN